MPRKKQTYYSRNRQQIIEKTLAKRNENPEAKIAYLVRSAGVRSRQRGVPFDISAEDVEAAPICPLRQEPLKYINARRNEPNGVSLDRIVPERGYVKGNVWVVSNRANTIKSDATPEEMILIAVRLMRKLHEEA